MISATGWILACGAESGAKGAQRTRAVWRGARKRTADATGLRVSALQPQFGTTQKLLISFGWCSLTRYGTQSDTERDMQLSFKRRNRTVTCSTRPTPVHVGDLREGEEAILDHLDLPEDTAIRLMELGFVPGTTVVAARSAPSGDPRVFRVDGSEIALRRETAAHLLVRR